MTWQRSEGSDPPVLVAGGPELLADAVRHMLATAGIETVKAGESPVVSGRRPVAVLVDPEPVHWAQAASASAPVVLVTSHGLPTDAAADAVLLGADAVLDAGADADDLVEAIRAVASERARLDSGQMRAVIVRARDAAKAPSTQLTVREREVLDLLEAGHGVKQMARLLGISPKTVENHQRRLFQKLGVSNRTEAVLQAHTLGLVTTDTGRPLQEAETP